MMEDDKKFDVEKVLPVVEPAGVKAHRAVRAGLAAIPSFGGPLTELLESIVQDPAAARRDKWIRTVSEHLQEQLDKGLVTVDSMRDDPRVVSAILELTQAAVRTHDEDKLEHLRNAVRNIAVKSVSFDEVLESVLINIAGQLPPIHFKVLLYAENPNFGHAQKTLITDIPELGNNAMADLVWTELYRHGLIIQDNLAFQFKNGYGSDNCLTELGSQLKSLIT